MEQKTNAVGFLIVAALLALAVVFFFDGFFDAAPDAPAQNTLTPPVTRPAP